MAAEKDSDDKTRIGTAPPPQPKLPSGRPPSTPAAEDAAAEHTHIGAAPPPKLRTPEPPPSPTPVAPAPPSAEHTHVGTQQPPRLQRPPAQAPPLQASPPPPRAVPPPAPVVTPSPAAVRPSVPDEEDEGKTVFVQRPTHTASATLQRVQPPGRNEVIGLDRSNYVMGRAHTCEIRLYSPTASREHARLSNRDGKWYVEPMANRTVLANGVGVKGALRVTHKMRLQFGGDELLFMDETAAGETVIGPVVRPRRRGLIGVIAVVVAALAAAAVWWFLRT
jgi:hypothetical protein